MKYIGLFLLSFALAFMVWCGLVFGEMGNPSKMSQWVWDDYNKKIEVAEGIKTPKVVVVAGSNALFGVDSEMLSKYFKKRVVNFGVNAGVELPVTLYMAKRVIKRGDTVLMPLEYPMYSYDGECGEQMIDFVLSRIPKLFWKLSLKEEFYIVWHVSFTRVWDGYFNISKKPMMVGVYGIKNLGKNGDQINTEVRYRSRDMLESLKKLKPERYGEKFEKESLGWEYLGEFVKWCDSRDVRVVFMPSTLMRDKRYFEDKKERWFYTHLADMVKSHGWEFAGEPYLYMYNRDMYFNTNFHLINKARKRRTRQMIRDLGTMKETAKQRSHGA